jgi:hypothetical protein
MAESLPSPKSYYRIAGGADDSWTEIVGGEFQAVPNIEYEVCCVKPSKSRRVIFASDVTYYFLVGGMRIRAGTDVITVGAPD